MIVKTVVKREESMAKATRKVDPMTYGGVADKEIKTAVKNFVKALRKIDKKYPNAGIGSTNVDETITEYLYEEIHF